LERQAELYDIIYKTTGDLPIVIDSNEVLKDPPSVLSKICAALNIAFDESMLTWAPNESVVDVPGAPYWYTNVQQSSGFQKQKTSSRPLPAHCEPLYKKALPYYEKLVEHAIRL